MAVISGPVMCPAKREHWDSKHDKRGGHYNTFTCIKWGGPEEDYSHGMPALRELFPGGEADSENFCLFSTSGVHGSYCTIEEEEHPSEDRLRDWESEREGPYQPRITFVVVQPRLVTLRYGICEPKTIDDFVFLKALRQSSWDAMQTIGAPEGQS